MKMEAIKRQGARTDLTSPKISAKFRSDDEVGQDAGVSGDTIRNYIALTQLVPELQQMVDEKKIALSPAYQLAALTPKEQGLLLETIDSEQTTPSLSQAQRMKKLSQSGELNEDTMLSIMMEQKKPEKNESPFPVKSSANISHVPIPHFRLRTPSSNYWTHGRKSASAIRADERTSSLFVRYFHAKRRTPCISTHSNIPPKM